MRYTATATCLSWIPPTAVQGMLSLPFGLGVAHYDRPPPGERPDIEALLAADAIRLANQLRAWIAIEDGQIVSHGMPPRDRLDSPALLGVAAEQTARLQTARRHDESGAESPEPIRTTPAAWREPVPGGVSARLPAEGLRVSSAGTAR